MTARSLRTGWLSGALACVAWGCASPAPPAPQPPAEPPRPAQSAPSEPDPTADVAEDDEPGLRHLTVSWSALADPHSLRAVIVRTDTEWEQLFTGSAPAVDFQSSLVVGLAEADVAAVRIDDVRQEGGETVVTAIVWLPDPRCGETPPGSVDLVVIDATNLPIRFDIQRAPIEC